MAWEINNAPEIKKVKPPEAEKPTPAEVAVVKGKQGEVTTEAKTDLAQLQQEFQTKQKSEKINMKQNTDALKNNATYRTQVGNILGLTAEQSTDAATLKQGIKGLQKALGFKDKAVDGALGPNTFKELKVRWEKRDPPNQEYQVFIKELITGKKAEQPAVIAPEPTANPILNEERTVKSNTIEVSLKNSVIEDRNRFGFRLFEDAKIVTDEQKGEAVSLELDGAIIDRDAYRITESSDKKSYELNIRAMDDNVLVGKEALKNALDKWKVTGKTINGNKDVDLIINKEKLTTKEKGDHVSIGKETYAEIQATATYETGATETTPIQSSILPVTPVDIAVDTMQNSNLNVIGDKVLNISSPMQMWDNPNTSKTEFNK